LSDHNTTECLLFPELLDRPLVAKFDQRQGSSDGGAILLRAADRRLELTTALAGCLEDERQAGKVKHELREMLTQRVMAIACGYADANDAARLASDPVHKLLVDRDPIDGADLALQPTLSRFENAPDRKQLFRMNPYVRRDADFKATARDFLGGCLQQFEFLLSQKYYRFLPLIPAFEAMRAFCLSVDCAKGKLHWLNSADG
jgi:Transposase DDE domain group 1